MTLIRLSVYFLLTVLYAMAINYDESKVPEYTLPDPLVMSDGTLVKTKEQWLNKRRPELLSLFSREMYGCMPGKPPKQVNKVWDNTTDALSGKAIRRQVTIYFSENSTEPSVDVLIYLPAHKKKPVPVFLGLNFEGNHTVHSDPGIKLSTKWIPSGAKGVEKNMATEQSRGSAASRWPVEMILSRGYGLVTAYYGDIDPDFHDGFTNGVHALFPELQKRKDNFAAISAWAWGLRRIMDYLEMDTDIDARKVVLVGHSRLGKTALWAGANDERFAIVISNESGAGGAALSKRIFGEDIEALNKNFPHWFCENFKKYSGQESKLPFDQHELIALIAPRPVYIASAAEDLWADPKGEFLAAKAAEPVYKLFGLEGLPADKWPAVDTPVHGTIGYHVRSGKHDLTAYDWEQYLTFADKHFRTAE